MENTSGQGRASTVPPEIDRWNWGAFLLTWIWGIGNKTFIAFLICVPFGFLIRWLEHGFYDRWDLVLLFIPAVNLIMMFSPGSNWVTVFILFLYFIIKSLLGIKGNSWAWQNKKWDSVEQFRRSQRKWALTGFIAYSFVILTIVMIISSMLIGKTSFGI